MQQGGNVDMNRIRKKKTYAVVLIFSVVLVSWWISLKSSEVYNVEHSNPFNVEEIKDTQHMVYPTRGKGYVIPTKSAAEIRELMMKHGVREKAKDDDLVMPANPFGNVSYDDNVAFHDLYQQEADALQEQDLDPGSDVKISNIPKLEGVNVVSMTLYGSVLKYTMGALRNAELIKINFPGWILRIYTETPSESPRFGIVPQTVIDRLRVLGAEIHYIDPAEDWVPPMMWRFLVADDQWVDRFIIRDTDARLTQRDAAAVNAWVKSGEPFNCIRDHPSHAGFAVSGGMWGAKPKELTNILRRSWREMMHGIGKDYLDDMNFLNSVIWPKVQHHAYCSDSVSCDQWEGAHPFPVPRYGYEHIGQVVSEHELGRPLDINILKQAGENPNCTPQGYNRLGMAIAMDMPANNRTAYSSDQAKPD